MQMSIEIFRWTTADKLKQKVVNKRTPEGHKLLPFDPKHSATAFMAHTWNGKNTKTDRKSLETSSFCAANMCCHCCLSFAVRNLLQFHQKCFIIFSEKKNFVALREVKNLKKTKTLVAGRPIWKRKGINFNLIARSISLSQHFRRSFTSYNKPQPN